MRVKYLKEVLARGRLKQFDHSNFYFKIDIRHGALFVAALRPSKAHSASLRSQRAVVPPRSMSWPGSGVDAGAGDGGADAPFIRE